jgi:hypothetical protein
LLPADNQHFIELNSDTDVGTDGRSMALGGYRPVDLERTPFLLPEPVLFEPLDEGNSALDADGSGAPAKALGVQGMGLWPLPFPQEVVARLRSLAAGRA